MTVLKNLRNMTTLAVATVLLGSTLALAQPMDVRKTSSNKSAITGASKAGGSHRKGKSSRSKKAMKKKGESKSENKKAVRPTFPRPNGKLASRR